MAIRIMYASMKYWWILILQLQRQNAKPPNLIPRQIFWLYVIIMYTISYRHYIPARAGARRVMAKGAFPRAEVTRGTDWDYGDDDGKLIHVCTM